jgi:hypothetical protein
MRLASTASGTGIDGAAGCSGRAPVGCGWLPDSTSGVFEHEEEAFDPSRDAFAFGEGVRRLLAFGGSSGGLGGGVGSVPLVDVGHPGTTGTGPRPATTSRQPGSKSDGGARTPDWLSGLSSAMLAMLGSIDSPSS